VLRFTDSTYMNLYISHGISDLYWKSNCMQRKGTQEGDVTTTMSELRSKRGKKESSQHPRGSRSYNNTNFRDEIYLRLRLLSTIYVEKEGIVRRNVLHTAGKQSYKLTCSIFYDRGLRSGSRGFSYLVFDGSRLCHLLERRLSSSRTQRSPGILTMHPARGP
jgi:hypothetical protein